MNKEVFTIVDRKVGHRQGAYSRACRTEYEFDTLHSAKNSNVHGKYKNRAKYKIQKWKVTYELIEDDVDKPSEEELELERVTEAIYDEIEKEVEGLDLDKFEAMAFRMKRLQEAHEKLMFVSLANKVLDQHEKEV